MREIVFDTETTGLSPAGGDRLVEIGCVELFNRVETGRTFHSYFNPGRPMPSEAEAVHGLSDRFLSDKPRFHERCEELLEFIGDSPLVAHNARVRFRLHQPRARAVRPAERRARRGWSDTLAIARQKFPGAKHSLDALCTRFGVDRSQRIKHGALLDAQLLAQVYVELTGGRQIGLTLVAELVEDDRRRGRRRLGRGAARRRRPPGAAARAVSATELARHAAFLAAIEDPIWNRL